uniref:Uncharacterized protein n=1 Tax=Ralstonia solanacearum TaxID=305 RepID=A0A0S4UPI2_RALSL|nr:protein of unknown function [Ralstonia solanacearum]CUV36066.1 protein of unknown function [Ralstonia solanacearum]
MGWRHALTTDICSTGNGARALPELRQLSAVFPHLCWSPDVTRPPVGHCRLYLKQEHRHEREVLPNRLQRRARHAGRCRGKRDQHW